jgi:hypothetical protein
MAEQAAIIVEIINDTIGVKQSGKNTPDMRIPVV